MLKLIPDRFCQITLPASDVERRGVTYQQRFLTVLHRSLKHGGEAVKTPGEKVDTVRFAKDLAWVDIQRQLALLGHCLTELEILNVAGNEPQSVAKGLRDWFLGPKLQIGNWNIYDEMPPPTIPIYVGFTSPADTLVCGINVRGDPDQIPRSTIYTGQQHCGRGLNLQVHVGALAPVIQ